MLDIPSYILGKKAGGGGGGTSNYEELSNKPSINDVTLSGNKTTADFGITIPTKTSDLTNDGDGSGLFSLTNYAETNVDGSGIYFGNSNDVNLRKKIDDTHYLDYPVETTTNKVTSISSSSTDTEYPSAKAVNDNCLKIVQDTGTPVTAVDTDQCLFFKCGKMVTANINFHNGSSISTNGSIYSAIPYLPSTNTRGFIVNTSGSSWAINVTTSGTITVLDRALPSGWYNGVAVYFTS